MTPVDTRISSNNENILKNEKKGKKIKHPFLEVEIGVLFDLMSILLNLIALAFKQSFFFFHFITNIDCPKIPNATPAAVNNNICNG